MHFHGSPCLFSLDEPARAPHVLPWIGDMSGPEKALQMPVLEMGEGVYSKFVAQPGGGPGL